MGLGKIESTWNEKQRSDDDDIDIDDDYDYDGDGDGDDLDVSEQLNISLLHLYIQLLQPDSNENLDSVERLEAMILKIVNLLKGAQAQHRHCCATVY